MDINNYTIKLTSRKFEFKGIEIVKQCSSRRKELWKRSDIYKVDTFNVLKRVAYRSTSNDLFKNNEIEIIGL